MAEDDKKPEPAEDLTAAAYAGPAIFITRTLITIADTTIRLTFADQYKAGGPVQYRTAVAMTFTQAVALKELLVKRLAPLEALMEAAEVAEAEVARGKSDAEQ